jgi:hypothetical protein
MNHPSDRKSAATRPRDSAESNDRRRLQYGDSEKRAHPRLTMIFVEYGAEELLQILMQARNAYCGRLRDRTETKKD